MYSWDALYDIVNQQQAEERALAEQREQSLRELGAWRERAIGQMMADLRFAAQERGRQFQEATGLSLDIGQPSSVPKGHGTSSGIFLSWMPMTLECVSVGLYVTASTSGKTMLYLAYPAAPKPPAGDRAHNRGLAGVRLVSSLLCQVVPRFGHAAGETFAGYRLLRQDGAGETTFDEVLYAVFRELAELWRMLSRSASRTPIEGAAS